MEFKSAPGDGEQHVSWRKISSETTVDDIRGASAWKVAMNSALFELAEEDGRNIQNWMRNGYTPSEAKKMLRIAGLALKAKPPSLRGLFDR